MPIFTTMVDTWYASYLLSHEKQTKHSHLFKSRIYESSDFFAGLSWTHSCVCGQLMANGLTYMSGCCLAISWSDEHS